MGCQLDPIELARRLARTHKLGPSYLGSGVCQLSEMDIRFPEDRPLYDRFSAISLTKLDGIRDGLYGDGNQLEPLDIEAAMLLDV
jgi:hypothetical protein